MEELELKKPIAVTGVVLVVAHTEAMVLALYRMHKQDPATLSPRAPVPCGPAKRETMNACQQKV